MYYDKAKQNLPTHTFESALDTTNCRSASGISSISRGVYDC